MIDAICAELHRYNRRNNLKAEYVLLGHVEYMELMREWNAERDNIYSAEAIPDKVAGMDVIRVSKENFFLIAGDYNAL